LSLRARLSDANVWWQDGGCIGAEQLVLVCVAARHAARRASWRVAPQRALLRACAHGRAWHGNAALARRVTEHWPES
jgi:hypothetical protein